MGTRMKDVLLELDASPSTIGQNIRAFRKGRGFTLQIMSDVTGIPITHLSQIENDKIDLGVKRAEVLAAALGVRPQDILFPEGVWKQDERYAEIAKKAEQYLNEAS